MSDDRVEVTLDANAFNEPTDQYTKQIASQHARTRNLVALILVWSVVLSLPTYLGALLLSKDSTAIEAAFDKWFSLIKHNSGNSPWSTITRLRHLFCVSESAMALRLLEIQSITALLIRLDESEPPKRSSSACPIDVSETGNIMLVRHPREVCERVLKQTARGNRHLVTVSSLYGLLDIRCEGNRRHIRTRHGVFQQYWVLGWVLHNSEPLSDFVFH